MRLSAKFFFVVLVLTMPAYAQSGRKKSEPVPPIPVAPPPATVDAEPLPAKISSLLVTGEVNSTSGYFHSNYFDLVSKEFAYWMKYEPRPFLDVTKGGKIKFPEAKVAAKNESDRHVLWLEAGTQPNAYGELCLAYVDYAILIPRTGRTLLTGRLLPGDEKIVTQGGIMKIPTTTRRTTLNRQLKDAARELAFKLKATSWF